MLVRTIMQPEVTCVEQDTSVKSLYQELVANDIAGAPVLDSNDFLVGVVSLTDIARCVAGEGPRKTAQDWGFSTEHRSFCEADIKAGLKVKDIMNPQVHQVHYDSTVAETLDLMLSEDIHRAVVTHRGHVIGIVTSGDMMRTLRDLLGAEDCDDDEDEDDLDDDE